MKVLGKQEFRGKREINLTGHIENSVKLRSLSTAALQIHKVDKCSGVRAPFVTVFSFQTAVSLVNTIWLTYSLVAIH